MKRALCEAVLISVSLLFPGCDSAASLMEEFAYIRHRPQYRPPQMGGVTLYRTNGPAIGSILSFTLSPWGLYAGTLGGGVYRSTDGGSSWHATGPGFTVLSLVADETTLYAGTAEKGVYKSIDGGESWRQSSLTKGSVSTLRFSGEALYAGTLEGEIFKGMKEGDLWTPDMEGLGASQVRTLAIGRDHVAYAGTTRGLFRKAPRDSRWHATPLHGLPVTSVAVSPENEIFVGTLGFGIFRSRDGGAHFTQETNGLTETNILTVIINPEKTILYAGSWKGTFKSTDLGESWTPASEGLGSSTVSSLLIGPDQTLYAGTIGHGIFRSRDGAQHWIPINTGLTNSYVAHLVLSDDRTFYAGTTGQGLFVSRDAGNTWTPLTHHPALQDIRSLSLGRDQTLYIGTDQGISQWKDGMWSRLGLAGHEVRHILHQADHTLLAGTDTGLFKMEHSGGWTKIQGGLAVNVLLQGKGDTLYAGTSRGLFRSNGRGETWMEIGFPHTDIRTIARGPNKTLFVGTQDGGIFKSPEEPIRWRSLSPLPAQISSLAVDPDDEWVLYAGTPAGLFWSNTGGKKWNPVTGELTNVNITHLLPYRSGGLLVATGGRGVYLAAVRIPRLPRIERNRPHLRIRLGS